MKEVFLKTNNAEFELDNPLHFDSIRVGRNGADTDKEWLWWSWEDDCERITMDSLNRVIGDAQAFLDDLLKLRDKFKDNCDGFYAEEAK